MHDFRRNLRKLLSKFSGGTGIEPLHSDRGTAFVSLIRLEDLFMDGCLVLILRRFGGWGWSWGRVGSRNRLGRDHLHLIHELSHCVAEAFHLLVYLGY